MDEGFQGIGGDGIWFRDLHEGEDFLVAGAGFASDDSALHDGGVIVECRFDLGRVDVEAAFDDEFFGAAEDVEQPVAIDFAKVACVHPSVRVEGCGCGIWIAEVAEHDVGAAREDFAGAVIAGGCGFVDFDFDAFEGRSNGDIGVAQFAKGCADTGACFGHAVAVLQGDAVEGFGFTFPHGIERGGAG